MKKVEIFTDGACKGNPGPGGWGAILRYEGHEKELSGGDPHTTNNKMELTAAIEALGLLRERCAIDLFTDSTYLRDGMTRWIHNWQRNGWINASKQPVRNADLWQQLLTLADEHEIEWHWVKAHAGHPENERADRLASDEAEALLRPEE